MPDWHFYLLRHHILFYIKFLVFCPLAPDEIRILYKKRNFLPFMSQKRPFITETFTIEKKCYNEEETVKKIRKLRKGVTIC